MTARPTPSRRDRFVWREGDLKPLRARPTAGDDHDEADALVNAFASMDGIERLATAVRSEEDRLGRDLTENERVTIMERLRGERGVGILDGSDACGLRARKSDAKVRSGRSACPKLNDMDTAIPDAALSASAAAHELGTSVPRVVRAARRLGLDERAGREHLRLSRADVQALQRELGRSRQVPGLSVTEVAVLAAVARSPFGLTSRRAVAHAAGISPTAASKATDHLLDAGLLCEEAKVIVAGRPRHVRMLTANRRHPRYGELRGVLCEVVPPKRPADDRVPASLRHLFWNTSPDQLNVAHGGPYIARRLLRTMNPAGLAWGSRNLTAADWREAANARGLHPAVRALADNLAAESDV